MFWRCCRGAGLILPALLVVACARDVQAEPQAGKDQAASALVQEALHREAFAADHERRALLREAAAQSPELSAVKWAQGYVRFGRQWLTTDDMPRAVRDSRPLSRYYRVRDQYADTVQGQFELAEWCERQGLADQQRAHLARVLDLAPDHAEAREALGFVRAGNQWISLEEIERVAQQAEDSRADFLRWRGKVNKLREGLLSDNPQRRERALAQLAEIDDSSAIPALEMILASDRPLAALPAIKTLGEMSDSAATRALARIAIFSEALAVRKAAAEQLQGRPYEAFVPDMLASLSSPVTGRFDQFRTANGRLVQQQTFVREGPQQNEVLVLATAYRRQDDGGDASVATARARVRMLQQLVASRTQVAGQNAVISQQNQRIMEALQSATQQTFNSPQEWWQWWTDHNELFVEGTKPTITYILARQETISDQITTGSGGGGTHDCLAAGTLVWTAQGPVAIEEIRVGDLVLAQDVASGELAYKPVLKTTVRPASPLLIIEAGRDERLETSGGHPFWVSGEGWIKARDLRSGMPLHTSQGTLTVSSVTEGRNAETYNLVVADFHNYFAGYDKVLCHDNTLRRPTQATVPGLAGK